LICRYDGIIIVKEGVVKNVPLEPFKEKAFLLLIKYRGKTNPS